MARSPYHLMHAAVFAFVFAYLYPKLRQEALATDMGRERLLATGYTGLTHEKEVWGIMVLSLVYNLCTRRALYRVFQMLQIASVVLIWLTGNRPALVGLLVVYATMYLTLSIPHYHGDSHVETLHSLDGIMGEDASSSAAHLVLCHVPWSSDCGAVESTFCKLSVEYANESTKFYMLDLSGNADLATELQIDTTTRSKQLPSIILLNKGEEVRRLPPFKDDGRVKKTYMTKKRLTEYFELDQENPSYHQHEALPKKRQ